MVTLGVRDKVIFSVPFRSKFILLLSLALFPDARTVGGISNLLTLDRLRCTLTLRDTRQLCQAPSARRLGAGRDRVAGGPQHVGRRASIEPVVVPAKAPPPPPDVGNRGHCNGGRGRRGMGSRGRGQGDRAAHGLWERELTRKLL